METSSPVRNRDGPSDQEVIDLLCAACQEALHAIAACWNHVDFQHGLGETARQIEAALESASRLKQQEAP